MIEELEAFCLDLKGTTQDIKWGNLCFLVGERIYCMAGLEPGAAVVFKVPKEEFAPLTEREGIRQAPHMARGQWVSVNDVAVLSKEEWKLYLKQSYVLVLNKLPKKLQRGILGEEADFS